MQCTMTTSPRATPLVHKEQELSMSWMPATSDVNVHSATTSDDNAPAADEIESSPSPDYFGLNLEQRRASIMDVGLFSNSSARNFDTGFPTQPINPAVTHNMSATTTSTTIHTAANSNGFNFDRPAFDLNSFQIQSGAQRRPPMNRFNTAPSNVKLVSSRAPANGDTCSPRSLAHASAQEGRTFPTEMEGVSPTTEQSPARPTYPATIMPTFAHSGSTKPETIAEATETPMEPDSSPFFSNPAPLMNLSLPPGSDFSKMLSQTPQTPAAIVLQKTKSRPTMNIEIPPSTIQLKISSRTMNLNIPGGISGVGKPTTPKSEPKINLVCASPAIRDTPVSTVVKTKIFATMNFIDGQVLYNLMRTKPEHVLILDVRCARNYGASHLRGALNLCVPTMLLKRDRFKLKQLLESFQKPSDAAKLEKWKECTTVVAYGSCSSDKSEVTIAQNVLNKFVKEGFTGRASVLKGGFNTFSESFEDQIQDASEEAEDENDKSGSGSKPLPVFGGVNIPIDNHPAVSFFNSIRQHTRIGTAPQQLQLTPIPAIADRRLPQWLDTICQKEAGKIIAQSFFNIEMEEQNRMCAALTLDMPGAHLAKNGVRFAGFEKGSKNRYKDVLPYDHTRVKLGGKCVCDYINASYIKAKRSNKRYIATQGPLPATFEDFWSVVWDNDVRVIVNLTADKERGHIKCHPYWNEDRYGSITVKKVSEHIVSLDLDPESHKPLRTRANTTMSYEDNPPLPTAADEESTVVIRYLAVTHAMKPFEPLREIVQIHYSGWPDLGTTNPSHILALVELANIISRQLSNPETAHQEAAVAWQDDVETETSARPMLIHCSAGCGRTGTFCTIDSVIDMMKRQRMEQDRELAAQRSPADTAATTIAENLGIKAPMSPRTANNSGVGSMASVFGTHAQQNRSRSNSRRGSVAPVSGPSYPPLDLRYMGDSSIDLIQLTVNDFREQRLNMVQTLRQYVLCYKVVWEWMARLHDRRSESNIIGARIKLRRQSINGTLPPQ